MQGGFGQQPPGGQPPGGQPPSGGPPAGGPPGGQPPGGQPPGAPPPGGPPQPGWGQPAGGPPPGGGWGPPPGPVGPAPNAAEQVKLPAIFLLVSAALSAGVRLLFVILNVIGLGLDSLSNTPMSGMVAGTFGLVISIVSLGVALFMGFGALKMKNLDNWALAIAASIVALVPYVSPCCCISLPFGIWAIIVLVKPEIRAAFRS